MTLDKYSFGIGDRFGQQGEAQLKAIIKAKKAGIEIAPVWNKSFREHKTIKSSPADIRKEAENAIKSLGWNGNYYVDADHINLTNVDEFIPHSDFFTIDVADFIGMEPNENDINEFIEFNKKYIGDLKIPGIEKPFKITFDLLNTIASKFLYAVNQANKIYNYIKDEKGGNTFIPEVSMDEVNEPQTPVELFFILSALHQYKVPIQTIAPKFTGRFNKGVDYVGDINQFSKEFKEDLLVIEYAVNEFDLPENLKLSVHSGSDKFAIYPIMGELIKKYDKGIHVKT